MNQTAYRKKPVVIEAFQMTRARRQDNRDWPEWLNRAWNETWPTPGAVSCEDYPTSDGTDRLIIYTLEGAHLVGWDDWIIQGVKGELYPCKPDIFAATYESAAAPSLEPAVWRELLMDARDALAAGNYANALVERIDDALALGHQAERAGA